VFISKLVGNVALGLYGTLNIIGRNFRLFSDLVFFQWKQLPTGRHIEGADLLRDLIRDIKYPASSA
jgi:hypothetical protein